MTVRSPRVGGVGLRLLRGSLDGREVGLAAIDARAGPAGARVRGAPYASLEDALDAARSGGSALALLLSDSQAGGPETPGFTALPASEAACRARLPVPWPKEPAWVEAGDPLASLQGLRPARYGDRAALAEIRLITTAPQRLKVLRDRPRWDRVLGASRRSKASGPAGVFVLEREGRVAAYAVLEETPAALVWMEHGAMPGAGELLIDLFWAALSAARLWGLERLEGWFLPPRVAASGLYPVATRSRLGTSILIGALDPAVPVPGFSDEDECRLSPLDLL